jgi:hypothetical protein
MYQVAYEFRFELSSLVVSVLKAAKKERPAVKRYNSSFYFGDLWCIILVLPPPEDQPELSVRKIAIWMLQVFGQGRIGELRGLMLSGEVDTDYCEFMHGDSKARRCRVFNDNGQEISVSPDNVKGAAQIILVFRGVKGAKYSTPVVFNRLRPALVGEEVARRLSLFAYLGDYMRRMTGRVVSKRGGQYQHSASHAKHQEVHGNGTFVATEVDKGSADYYYITDTVISNDIRALFTEAAVPDGFSPYASRGNSESLLYDAHSRYKLFTNFEHEVCVARSRHSLSQFKSTYYHTSDERHVSAIQSLVVRAGQLGCKLHPEELLVWFSKDLNSTFEGNASSSLDALLVKGCLMSTGPQLLTA